MTNYCIHRVPERNWLALACGSKTRACLKELQEKDGEFWCPTHGYEINEVNK